MKKGEPVGGKLFTPPFILCLILALIALYFLAKRYMLGLGAVTNMSDGYPWGIWITYDVVVGTALGCGGYAMALLVYIFNKGEYHSLVRPALLASLMGYSLAAVSVFFDIGRYWQMHNLFLPWYANPNSVLLEVALCIAAYCLVLWIEFAPVLLQKFKFDNLNIKLNKIMFFIIALGILLPTMHQSSLGSVMIIAGPKLSPLWWTPFLPLLFLISAIIMGYSFVLFESGISTLRHKTPDEGHLLNKISAIFPWLIGIYLIIRFVDISYRGQLGLAFSGSMLGNLFLLENILLLFPMLILASPALRKRKRVIFFSAVSLLMAGTLYRFNAYIIGFNPGDNWTYFPAVPEMFITLGIVSTELMVYLWFIKRLPVFQRA
jgi:Ni/Fe-hydrogenase subunit HybB-like protein